MGNLRIWKCENEAGLQDYIEKVRSNFGFAVYRCIQIFFSIIHFYSIVEMEEPTLNVVVKHRPSPLRGEGKRVRFGFEFYPPPANRFGSCNLVLDALYFPLFSSFSH